MAYATHAQFVRHWGASRAASLVSASAAERQATIEDALEASSSMIDAAALRGGFALPITAAPQLLMLKSILIATYLFLQPLDMTEQVKAGRAHCQAWLDLLADGGGLPEDVPVRAGSMELISMPGASSALTQERLAAGRRCAP
jgi:phage gp36-like protein